VSLVTVNRGMIWKCAQFNKNGAMRRFRIVWIALAALSMTLFAGGHAAAAARQVNEYEWEGVQRIVAVGDIHGDYGNYLETLRLAGLVDKRGRWIGGEAHLVQTGDIPDRGPDTLKIIEHLEKLEKQAERKGGRVHSLIGNHEAMNVYGDLRYVSDGEYKAFVTGNSAVLRDRVFELQMQQFQAQDPEGFAALPPDYREQWNLKHPLGWVEHRLAWSPAWNPEGKLANWVLGRKVAIRINDVMFLHGGISGFYCQNSLDSMTDKVIGSLNHFDPQNMGILEDEFGPLWYRGLSGVQPEAPPETVDAILAQHGVQHIVVGHTPTEGIIWPQYHGKVVMIDSGISRIYGGHIAYLEITPKGLFAGYPNGKLPIPMGDEDRQAYLEKVIAMDPQNPYLQERLEQLMHPAVPEAAPAAPEAATGSDAERPAEPAAQEAPARAIPICGISR
jgi:hypothetical protein